MTGSHRAIRKLVLAYESLAGEERARADEHLAGNEAARKLLADLRALEEAAAAPLPLPEADPEDELTPAEQLAERACFAELIAIVETDDASGRPRRSLLRGLFRTSLLLPAAAVVAAALLLPFARPGDGPVRNLSVVPERSGVSEIRGLDREPPAVGTLRSGERFHLRFTLAEDARVLVIHMDPAGAVSVAWPEDPSSPAPLLPGGEELAVPTRATGWVLDRETGTESFVVVALSGNAPGRPAFQADLDAALADARGRPARLEALLGHLGSAGSPQLIEFRHVD